MIPKPMNTHYLTPELGSTVATPTHPTRNQDCMLFRYFSSLSIALLAICAGIACDDDIPDAPEVTQTNTIREVGVEIMPFTET